MASILEQAQEIRAVMDGITAAMTDEQAAKSAALFPLWEVSKVYQTGERLKYHDELYKVLQPHTSQADWPPDAAVSLYVKISDPAEEWPVWVQPLGAHDAYPKGAKVSHKGKRWVSAVDANTWEPGVYGWEEAEA
nr:MAG TPA: ChiA1-BD-binding domain protein [Caudoviricetes sp.]